MKLEFSPIIRISFGLIMLTLSILLVSDWMGLIPHEDEQKLEQRKKFGEALAVQFSSMAQAGELKHIRTVLEAMVSRNRDIQSAAFRSINSGEAIEVGKHAEFWNLAKDEKYSTVNQIIVPILKGGERWGSVEVSFTEDNSAWYSIIPGGSFYALILFVCVTGFSLYQMFLRRALRELDPSQVIPDRVKAAYDSLAEGLLILDEKGQVVLANKAFLKSTATAPSGIIGLNANDLNWSTYQTNTKIRPDHMPWVRVLATGNRVTGEKLTIHKDSDLQRSYTLNCTPIHDDKKNIRGTITTFDDMTELEKKNEALAESLTSLKQTQSDVKMKNRELQYLATRDPLTNCLNRRSFSEQYATLYENAKTQKSGLICIMVDIDHFKRVNDNYGHGVGDKVIKFVADVLGKKIRRDDVIGRYGGEEFCIILNGSSVDEALIVTERMRKEITSGDPGLFTSALRITASFGVASIYDEPEDKDDLVNMADKALYLAKESGRNKVMVWEAEGNAQVPTNPVKLRVVETARPKDPPLVEPPAVVSAEISTKARIEQLEKIAQEKAEQLDRYASYDALTQLPERNLFIDRVDQALLQARRGGRVLAVLSLGLENLGRINDTLGHDCAQEVLQETAQRLKDVLRSTDTISLLSNTEVETTISKLNVGEFGLLLPAVKDTESIAWIVKRIFDALQEPMFVQEHNITILGNVGIGVFPSDAHDAITLIKHASISKYYAEQQSGSNNVEYYSEEINTMSAEQLQLEGQMTQAIENEEFEVFYQPKIDIKSGEITGFESLLRWNHPTRGTLTPNEFIEIAERTRLINLIGDWVLRQSCLDILDFRDASSKDLSIAVNFSSVQFSQPDLVDRILETIKSTGMNPKHLELELTESCLMEDLDEAYRSLARLQSEGIVISIDDFGTGYSGLSYLRKLPIDVLKIDRSFIADIGTDEHDTAIVRAVMGMAKALDLNVVAEGVETVTQLNVLRQMGCEAAQGYLFSKPVNKQAANELLLSHDKIGMTGL